MALSLVYDPRGHSFDSWSSLMVEAYAGQQLEMNVPENKWQEFAVGVSGNPFFQENAIPDPYLYNHWHDWAQALVGAVSQKVE